jgi:hypothetical protein
MRESAAEDDGGDSRLGDWVKRTLERERAAGFPSLPGAAVRLRLPVRQALVDALLNARPRHEGDKVKSVRLLLAARDRIRHRADDGRIFLLPTEWRLDAGVTRYVAFDGDGRLRLTLLNGGLVRMLLNVAPLPDFLRVQGENAEIDLGLLLRRADLGWLIPLIVRCTFNVEPGVLWLDLDLRTPADGTAPDPLSSAILPEVPAA